MGFFRNIINAAAEKILNVTHAASEAREPVRRTLTETVGSLFQRVVAPWKVREPADREPAAREPAAREPAAREPAAREPAAREPAGFKRSDRAKPAGVPIKSLAHRLKAAGLNLKPTEWMDKNGKVFYRFTFPDRLKSNDAFIDTMKAINKSFQEFNPNAKNMDLLISGHFGKAGFRALSPLLPYQQSVSYSIGAGIELAEYKSGMSIDELDSIDYTLVEADMYEARGD